FADGDDVLVVGLAFRTVIAGVVVLVSVVVVFAICFVMALLVGDEIAQGVAVMRGNEVDAGGGTTRGMCVEVRAAGKAGSHFANGLRFPAPELAHTVAIATIPFAPDRREVAHLITALAQVPGLGNQVHLTDDGILMNE